MQQVDPLQAAVRARDSWDGELLPLLEAVMRGMRERTEMLGELEREMSSQLSDDFTEELIVRAARHRRELETTRRELAKLGCTLLGGARASD